MGEEPADFLIIGGGSAGCVLAARLSEVASNRVVLIEAGPDIREGTIPPELAAAYPGRTHYNPDWLWGDMLVTRGETGNNQRGPASFYEQARILGGGSTINGMCANRGSPFDYDEWAQRGARGWGWKDVLPFFRKLESDADLNGHWHGQDGPMPIQRHRRAAWTDFANRIEKHFGAMGLDPQEDQNGAWADGVFPTTINLDKRQRRGSTALVYLTEAVRRRPNLQILTESVVETLHVENGAVHAAQVRRGGESISIKARETIVSAGALQTPVLLMRSGIGPAAHLTERGIPVKAARPGIGENLQEHPLITIVGFLNPAARLKDRQSHHLQALLRYSSQFDGVPPGDMHVMIASRAGWHAVGQRLGVLGCWVNKSFSTGRVRLAESPDVLADVDFRMLSDPRDMERLKHGFRLCVDAMTAALESGQVLDVFPAGHLPRTKSLARPSRRNDIMTALAGPMMDVSGFIRRRMMAYGVGTDLSAADLAANDEMLDAYLRERVNGCWHPCGTVRMGDPADPMAGADAHGRVIGVDGLRVCDASLMPTIPCANLNIPVIMMAEKIAATVLSGD